MTVYSYKRDTLPVKKGAVIALGFFDGVHTAHRKLLKTARDEAARLGVPFGVFTFDTESQIKIGEGRIYTGTIRERLIKNEGADFIISAQFSDISEMSAEEFVKKILIDEIGAQIAVSGFNFRFGKGAAGDASELKRLMRAYGGDALICERYEIDGVAVSSTAIKEMLKSGRIREANRLLGAPYRINGEVKHGRGVGKSLGFPTLNTNIGEGLVSLQRGVYRTAVSVGDRLYPAITNIGVCPTYEKRDLHAETYIINYSGDLYGFDTEIYFLNFLREEIEFPSEEQLIMQINIDKNIAIKEFDEIKWLELGLK